MTRAYNTATTQQNTGGAVAGVTAGKNKIINGDFFVNQRNFTSNTSAGYGFDRWSMAFSSGTSTYTPQTFAPGTAPVSGYEGATFARIVTASQTGAGGYSLLKQPIENVRTLAGQTATVSFWAKSATGTPKIAVEFAQNFGSGGSPSSEVDTYAGQVTLSTSWARYSVSVTVPSISGKTIGTTVNTSDLTVALWVSAGTTFDARTGSIGIQNNTFDIWGVQVEAGSVATPFTTATGTIQGELAACQRYYYQSDTDVQTWTNLQYQANVNVSRGGTLYFPQTMRTTPTLTLFDSPGNSGKISVSASSGGYSDNITPNMFGTGRNTYAFYAVGTYVLGYVSKITASAEL